MGTSGSETRTTVDEARARAVLAGAQRVAVVGASDARDSFGRTVVRELRRRGRDVVAVHPTATSVAGEPAVATVAEAWPVDLAVVMVPAPVAADVVRDCAAAGVARVWLFRGLGGSGSASAEAVAAAEEAGVELVPGACPLMFLEPVGLVHRIHRSVRRREGRLR